jgi:hypothetical protein
MKAAEWHFITSLQLAIARAILAGDRRGEQVLTWILNEELAK